MKDNPILSLKIIEKELMHYYKICFLLFGISSSLALFFLLIKFKSELQPFLGGIIILTGLVLRLGKHYKKRGRLNFYKGRIDFLSKNENISIDKKDISNIELELNHVDYSRNIFENFKFDSGAKNVIRISTKNEKVEMIINRSDLSKLNKNFNLIGESYLIIEK